MFTENHFASLSFFAGKREVASWLLLLSRSSWRTHEELPPKYTQSGKIRRKTFHLNRGSFYVVLQLSVNPLKYLQGLAFKKSLNFLCSFCIVPLLLRRCITFFLNGHQNGLLLPSNTQRKPIDFSFAISIAKLREANVKRMTTWLLFPSNILFG